MEAKYPAYLNNPKSQYKNKQKPLERLAKEALFIFMINEF